MARLAAMSPDALHAAPGPLLGLTIPRSILQQAIELIQ